MWVQKDRGSATSRKVDIRVESDAEHSEANARHDRNMAENEPQGA